MELRKRANMLPSEPGVYQFLDQKGQIIYVGKAKSLRSRVSSYFVNSHDHSPKVRAMVAQITSIRHIVVESENDALLLENNLIKQLQPHYNILLKDAKSYPWIVITAEDFPRVISTRRLVRDGSEYFGPYSSITMQRAVLELIKGLYPLRSCKLNLSPEAIARGKYSVCLEYHIGNCRGACVGIEGADRYATYIAHARQILRGDLSASADFFETQMVEYAAALEFEKAQKVKQKITALENYRQRSIIVSPTMGNVEVVGMLQSERGDIFYCNHMSVAGGAVVSSYSFELRSHLGESPAQMLGFAIGTIERLDHRAPVVVPWMPEFESDSILYSERCAVPQRGDKLKLLEMSVRNCKAFEFEKQKYIEKTDPARHSNRIMDGMKRDLNLDREPRHIECFDNSNIQGSSPVASCVVFRDGKPCKRDYRHFNIKTVEGANDFASMAEVLLRRYSRLVEQGASLPDLIVVDGGKGQLSAAYEVLQQMDLHHTIPIIGLAKRMEEVFFPGNSTPHYLSKTGETLKVLMHIRDEAHRFGITFHRKKRSIAMLKSELQQVPGLGKTSVEKLLVRYATMARMRETPRQELDALIGAKRADLLLEFLNRNQNQE